MKNINDAHTTLVPRLQMEGFPCEILEHLSGPAIHMLIMHLGVAMIFVKDRDHKLVFGNRKFGEVFNGNSNVTMILGKRSQEYLPDTMKRMSKCSDEEVAERCSTWGGSYVLGGRPMHTTKIPIVVERRYLGSIGFTVDAELSVAPSTLRYSTEEYVQLLQQLSCLGRKEVDLIKMVGQGMLNKQLATQFDVSLRSIEKWRQKILLQLGLSNSAELIRFVVNCERYGLL